MGFSKLQRSPSFGSANSHLSPGQSESARLYRYFFRNTCDVVNYVNSGHLMITPQRYQLTPLFLASKKKAYNHFRALAKIFFTVVTVLQYFRIPFALHKFQSVMHKNICSTCCKVIETSL